MKKALLVVAGVVLPLLLVEILLRLTGIGFIKPEYQFGKHTGARLESGVFEVDPDLFWREPGGETSPDAQADHFVRVGDTAPAKSQKFRIMCLGDSCTRLSARNRPYSVLLQKILGTRQVEVFNASLPGYTSYQGLAWLKKQLLGFEPDLLIVYFGWNDHVRSTGIADKDYAALLAPNRPRLLSIWRPKIDPPPLRVDINDYEANLREIAQLAQSADAKCVLILGPTNINRENTAAYLKNGAIVPGDQPALLNAAYQEKVRLLAGMPGVELLDLASDFAEIAEPKILLMRDGIHPTETGHAVIARTIADFVGAKYLGRGRPATSPVAIGLNVLGQSQVNRGDWSRAAVTYRRAIKMAPGEAEPRLGLAWVLATCPVDSIRDGAGAVAVLQPLQEKHADSPDFGFIAAAAHAENGAFDKAIAELDHVLSILASRQAQDPAFARAVSSSREKYLNSQPLRIPQPTQR